VGGLDGARDIHILHKSHVGTRGRVPGVAWRVLCRWGESARCDSRHTPPLHLPQALRNAYPEAWWGPRTKADSMISAVRTPFTSRP
jgi:hypothetical protein